VATVPPAAEGAAGAAVNEQSAKWLARPLDVPVTAATAAASEHRIEVGAESKIPLLGLFQNEAWQGDYDDVPIYGNGALH
jgi:hypothetical protein